ncbi:hypothetical protein DVH05_022273 [Phytophthora capsici]|nr:hypothetical protein DVH05_022273 [Phytophthora capsici]
MEKVDCKTCHKQVSAAANRLQSHMRKCPARSEALVNSINVGSGSGIPDAIPTTSELIEQAVQGGRIAEEQATITNPIVTENNAPPMKKQRVSLTKSQGVANIAHAEDMGVNSVDERQLEIEEKRLQLEIKRDRREESREQLSLELLKAQVRKETLLAEKEGYEAKVLLALSRKQLRDQGVSEEEIDRILPIPSSQTDQGGEGDVNTN